MFAFVVYLMTFLVLRLYGIRQYDDIKMEKDDERSGYSLTVV
jgi:hypothetical protein